MTSALQTSMMLCYNSHFYVVALADNPKAIKYAIELSVASQ